jgi:prevent-host-death family protein
MKKGAEVINVHAAKTNLSALLEQVAQGKRFIIAKAGVPYAELVPITSERKLGFIAGSVGPEFFDPLPEDELAGWDATAVHETSPTYSTSRMTKRKGKDKN